MQMASSSTVAACWFSKNVKFFQNIETICSCWASSSFLLLILIEMEIINANTAMLSNFEVLRLLTSLRGKGDQARNQSGSLATITYETIKYLEGTPAAVQSDGCFKKFLEDVKKFGLTKKEKTMLLNLRPKTAVEISLIVQSTDTERLTEEQTEELIELIQNTLPEIPE